VDTMMNHIKTLISMKKSELIADMGTKRISLGDYFDIQVKLREYEIYLKTEVVKLGYKN
jgi:hypothetical protein